MSPETFEASKQRLAALIKRICSEYGIHGNVIYHAPSPIACSDEYSRNRLYIIAGPDRAFEEDPPPKWIDPEQIIRRNSRNCKLFHPGAWAFDLSSGGEMEAIDQLVEYAKRVEFLAVQYGQREMELPDKLRLAEVNKLITTYDWSLWTADNPDAQKPYQMFIDRFFKQEKSQNPLRKSWMSYYRSEKFPDGKGPFAKLVCYFRRARPEVSMDQLRETNKSLCTLQMQEYEFQFFRKFMASCYPEVSYVVGDKEAVNHGLTPRSLQDKVAVRNVTWEEYAAVRKERFAEEGYDALKGLNPSSWVFRDIHYRAVDAPIIASVYNMMTLQYAKCDPLETLKQFGELGMEDIPAANFMNFVSLAKANGLRFYIDTHGDYALPSFDVIHVVYNQGQADTMSGIMNRLLHDKVAYSHTMDARPSLNKRIARSEQLQACQDHSPAKQFIPERD